MRKSLFTPEELEELAAFDRELDKSFVATVEERKESTRRDVIANNSNLDNKQKKIAAYQAAYYAAHKDEIAAYQAAYRAAHKDEIAAYRAAHKDEIAAQQAAYYAAHKDEIAAYQAAYYAAHKDEIAEKRKKKRIITIP